MKIVRTAVAEIGYLESGQSDGFPVLFLHGFPDDAHTWDRVVAELEGLPLRLVRPFQRGCGPSRVTAIAAISGEVAALAQDVLDLAGCRAVRVIFVIFVLLCGYSGFRLNLCAFASLREI